MCRVGLILLAAGASTRLGQPKQLVRLQGQTLLRLAAEAAVASQCRPIVVVLGAQAAQMQPELLGLPVDIVENLNWESGMASSIQAGLNAMPDDVEAITVILCDQPGLSSKVIETLMIAWQTTEAPLAACEYAGTLGVPAVFSRDLFSELLALSRTEGAKRVIARHAAQAARISFPNGAWDIDTPEDLAGLSPR